MLVIFIAQWGWVFTMLDGAIVDVYWSAFHDDARGTDDKILSTEQI